MNSKLNTFKILGADTPPTLQGTGLSTRAGNKHASRKRVLPRAISQIKRRIHQYNESRVRMIPKRHHSWRNA